MGPEIDSIRPTVPISLSDDGEFDTIWLLGQMTMDGSNEISIFGHIKSWCVLIKKSYPQHLTAYSLWDDLWMNIIVLSLWRVYIRIIRWRTILSIGAPETMETMALEEGYSCQVLLRGMRGRSGGPEIGLFLRRMRLCCDCKQRCWNFYGIGLEV